MARWSEEDCLTILLAVGEPENTGPPNFTIVTDHAWWSKVFRFMKNRFGMKCRSYMHVNNDWLTLREAADDMSDLREFWVWWRAQHHDHAQGRD